MVASKTMFLALMGVLISPVSSLEYSSAVGADGTTVYLCNSDNSRCLSSAVGNRRRLDRISFSDVPEALSANAQLSVSDGTILIDDTEFTYQSGGVQSVLQFACTCSAEGGTVSAFGSGSESAVLVTEAPTAAPTVPCVDPLSDAGAVGTPQEFDDKWWNTHAPSSDNHKYFSYTIVLENLCTGETFESAMAPWKYQNHDSGSGYSDPMLGFPTAEEWVGQPKFKQVNVYGKWSGGPTKWLAVVNDAQWAWSWDAFANALN